LRARRTRRPALPRRRDLDRELADSRGCRHRRRTHHPLRKGRRSLLPRLGSHQPPVLILLERSYTLALSTTSFTRRINIHGLVVGLSLTGGLLAVLPIVAGVVGDIAGTAAPRTAFATAPGGDYAVFARAGETVDEILVTSP